MGPLGNVRLTNRSGACECGRYLDINTEIFEHQTFTLCEIYLSCSRRNPLLDSRSIWYVLRHNISKLIPSWHDCPTFITPTFLTSDIHHPLPKFRHSSPRHSSPQTFITPCCRIRHSSPRTFITSDVHHLRHSSPQTFITSDVHHPLPKFRHSSPQTFITSDIHHPLPKIRRSSPQTFIT